MKPVIKFFGVGNAGVNLLEAIAQRGPCAVNCFGINSEAPRAAAAFEQLHLQNTLLRALGTGGDPDRGRALAEASEEKLKSLCDGADVVFVLAGLGGGAGGGISPVLARIARDKGALVLAFAATPFDCEGKRRQDLAEEGLRDLKAAADGVICMPNQRVLRLIDENTSITETFKRANELLADAVLGVWRLLSHKGLIEIRFEELAGLLRGRHVESICATAEAAGPDRSRELLDRLFSHPMLESSSICAGCEIVLVNLMAGPDLAMAEVNRVMEGIQDRWPQARVIMGAAVDAAFGDNLGATLIVARKDEEAEAEAADRSTPVADLNQQLLDRFPNSRPGSRFVPPPPGLGSDQVEKMLLRENGGSRRGRKSGPRMKQGHLPLEIVSKGRFDKSEPTIHRGEDLDVPTYIRRGVTLN
ncbi:MAG TPA: cell division protein FtsZ [Verrucomicrobiae bacterium]|nr:cell division protein FtsZ [Verrucomicrobiae bacterium]